MIAAFVRNSLLQLLRTWLITWSMKGNHNFLMFEFATKLFKYNSFQNSNQTFKQKPWRKKIINSDMLQTETFHRFKLLRKLISYYQGLFS